METLVRQKGSEAEKSRISEIAALHNEISGLFKMTLDKAIRIGELLTEQKTSLQHGEFSPWIKANLPFTDRTVRRYMQVYENRKLLKTDTVSDLSEAYKLLEAPKQELLPDCDSPDFLNKFWDWHRKQKHLTADLDYDLRFADTLEKCIEIRDRALKLTQDAAEVRIHTESYLGGCLIKIKESLPKVKEARTAAQDIIKTGEEYLSGRNGILSAEQTVTIEGLLDEAAELSNDCNYILEVAV